MKKICDICGRIIEDNEIYKEYCGCGCYDYYCYECWRELPQIFEEVNKPNPQ